MEGRGVESAAKIKLAPKGLGNGSTTKKSSSFLLPFT
jgi:hypothetical protein